MGLKPIVAAIRQAFPDLHLTVEDVIAAGDSIVIRTTMTGTHEGVPPPCGRIKTMVPLLVLVIATLLARLAGWLAVVSLRTWPAATRVGLAVMLWFTAAAHFNSMRADLIRMVPPAVPNPELMVTFTGVCEILGGIGLLVPPTRRIAAGALMLFLVAVLPANIHAARAGVTLGGAAATPLVPRIAMQLLFIALLWWAGWRHCHQTRA